MDKIYYSPSGFWKGYAAIDKLATAAKVTKQEARKYLKQQPIWQIYLPRPKYIPQARFDIDTPNEAHQADLLFMPTDKGYKYILTVIDVASRYKEAEPLKTKQSSGVAEAFKNIYNRILTWPKTLMVDPGKEFMGVVKTLMTKHDVNIKLGRVNIHKDQALVERFNKTLAEKLFAYQYNKELFSGRNREWVANLPIVVKGLNNTSTRLIGMKPIKAIKMDKVTSKASTPYHRPVGKFEKVLPLGTRVRRLYNPGEVEDDSRQRATDPNWSIEVHEIEKVLIKPNQPALYYITGGRRGFVREEIMVID